VIGWLLRKWQRRHPGLVLALSLALLLGGLGLLLVWIVRDLSHGKLVRPAIAVLILAVLSIRLIASFRPYGGR